MMSGTWFADNVLTKSHISEKSFRRLMPILEPSRFAFSSVFLLEGAQFWDGEKLHHVPTGKKVKNSEGLTDNSVQLPITLQKLPFLKFVLV